MNLDRALWLIKNLPRDPEADEAMAVLRSSPFTVARFEKARWDDNLGAAHQPVLSYIADDDQRADLPEALTLYRWADPKYRAGLYWEDGPGWALIQGLSGSSPLHAMWTTTVRSSDARVLAEFRSASGHHGGEYVVDAQSLTIEPA